MDKWCNEMFSDFMDARWVEEEDTLFWQPFGMLFELYSDGWDEGDESWALSN